MRMKTWIAAALLFALSLPAAAGSIRVGELRVHFNALPSTELTAEIARQYGITRSANRALLNVSVRRGEPGADVAVADNGLVGVQRVTESPQPFDAILMDMQMPVMDGFEFLRELRQREDGRLIPVVVVTAKDLSTDEKNLLRTSVENVIQKGTISHEDLLADIRNKINSLAKH